MEMEPLMAVFEWKMRSKAAVSIAASTIGSIVRSSISRASLRVGSLTYCLSAPREGGASEPTLYFEEMFASPDEWKAHVTPAEGEALFMLFTSESTNELSKDEEDEKKPIVATKLATLNIPEKEVGLVNALRGLSSNAAILQTSAGYLFHPKPYTPTKRYGTRLLPSSRSHVRIQLLLEPSVPREELVAWLEAKLCSMKVDIVHMQSFVSDLPWPEDGFSSNAIQFTLTSAGGFCTAEHISFKRSILEGIAGRVRASKTIFTAENWDDDSSEAVLDRFTELGFVHQEHRQILAGYLVHPAYLREWHESPDSLPDVALPPDTEEEEDSAMLSVRRHPVTGEPKAVLFSPAMRGGRGSIGFSNVDTGGTAIPLLSLLCGLLRLGSIDGEVPIGFLFGQLAQLRALRDDIRRFNERSEPRVGSVEADRIRRLGETLRNIGYGFPEEGPLEISELDTLIKLLEREYADTIRNAREAAAAHAPIEYLGLGELFPIGSLVVSESAGAIGVASAFRVIGSRFVPTLSVMGARRYAFHLSLEAIVALAGKFVSVPFEIAFEEWAGKREMSLLPVTPLVGDLGPFCARAALVQAMDHPVFQRYGPGTFFPHTHTARGSAGSRRQAAEGGIAMIDTEHGLSLGHAPVMAVDEVGIAIATTIKTFRHVQRSASHASDETPRQREERFVAAGLNFWSTVPDEIAATVWPTVVAFSFTTKAWGHVLVDGLSSPRPTSEAWESVVAPDAIKTTLVAMTGTAIGFFAPPVHFRDIVDGKGQGALFLLYGPPGTGKTLSVEALALHFGRPLYTVSFAELGSSVSELEERLADVLALAARWGALVLLDEGDALVERRQPGQLQLSAMTSVLLRLLETFQGAFFITTNRVANFDDAALSRVTLAVPFSPLDSDGKVRVWKTLLSRICDGVEDFDFHRLGAFRGGPRNIGAVIRMALSLCAHRGVPFGCNVLYEALDMWTQFSPIGLDADRV